MTYKSIDKNGIEFSKALTALEKENEFKYVFPFTHNKFTYETIIQCLSFNTNNENPVVKYSEGVELPGALRIKLERIFFDYWPNGLFNGRTRHFLED